jgi:hypothetical protein
MQFARTIGIDYSGAQTPMTSLKGLRVSDNSGAETVQCPSACYYHSTAIEMSAFAEPDEPEPRRNALAHVADA